MNRRTNLREFQQAPHREPDGHQVNDAAQAARLGVLSGGNYWLIRLDEAQEVLAVGQVTPVPLTRRWFRGITNVRGHLYSVIDFAHFSTGEPGVVSSDARLVVLAERFHVSAALLVERMLGLRTLAQLEPAEESGTQFPWAHARYRDADGRIWRELAVSELVQHNDFLQAGF